MSKESKGKLNLELSKEYYQKGILKTDAWFKVAARDYTELIKAFDFAKHFSLYPSPIELLDVGCGTGKFPSMLLPHLPSEIQVLYDYLDPSQHSLNELKKKLTPPYQPRKALKTTLEELQLSECSANGYHIIWCLQSLYCVQHEALAMVLQKLRKLINLNNGVVMIFLASQEAFYNRLFNLYNQQFYPGKRSSYVTAEEVTDALDSLSIQYGVMKLNFPHTISCSEEQILEKYLQQCVFDRKGYEYSRGNETMSSFMNSFSNGREYQFPQDVWLIIFCSNSQKTKEFWQEFGGGK